ncbi:MAG: DUF4159 domain-containing protein [Gemmatimonadetes bacterium]|nr:DUF4159 domain-containing protein [Gemmatimonadota bacterium]
MSRSLLHLPVLALVLFTALNTGCAPDSVDEPTYVAPPGADFMSQQAPPRVSRPSFVDPRGPRMNPNEIPGRYPFYWTRAIYSGWGRRGWGQSWATDYPKGDQQFLVVLKRLVRLNAYDWDNAIRLDDPILRRFPIIYAVEVGGMDMTNPEVEGLRNYLEAGGFLIVDDFWGQREWDVFEYNIRRVYPDRPIVDITLDHPIYSAYYDIEEVKQVPPLGGQCTLPNAMAASPMSKACTTRLDVSWSSSTSTPIWVMPGSGLRTRATPSNIRRTLTRWEPT